LLEVAAELEHMIGPGTGLRLADVLRWPGVVNEVEPDLDEIRQAILDSLDAALAELIATREREGERTGELLRQRCAALRTQVARVRVRRPEVLARWREKLLARLAEIPADADPHRLEQELVLIAQRLDVDEELDRLDTHLDEIEAVLDRRGTGRPTAGFPDAGTQPRSQHAVLESRRHRYHPRRRRDQGADRADARADSER
jgi:uncharacterized protein (TIGR00255 family)